MSVAATMFSAIAMLAVSAGVGHAASFTWTPIKAPKAAQTLISGINDIDQVVGSAQLPGGSAAFVWTNGSLVIVPTVVGFGAINSKGLAVGYPVEGGPSHYDFYNSENAQLRTYNGHIEIVAMSGINISGTACGFAENNKSYTFVATAKGKSLTVLQPFGSVFSAATAINDDGTVVGYYRDSQAITHGFVYKGETFTSIDPPGSTNTSPSFITKSGIIGGIFDTGTIYPTGFTLDNGIYTTFAVPGATKGTFVKGLGPHGETVGEFVDDLGVHGFIYRNGNYYKIDYPGQQNTSIDGVNALGSLIGAYYLNHKYVDFIAQCAGGAFCTK